MQVTVTEHDGKDDDEGERVDGDRVQASPNFRLFQPVTARMLLRVALKNMSSKPLSFVPVYVGEDGSEEPEDKIDLARGEVRRRVAEGGGGEKGGVGV